MSIDDLVNELTKKNSSPEPKTPVPAPFNPTRPPQSSVPPVPPKSYQATPPTPAPKTNPPLPSSSAPSQQSQSAPVKEYQTSIRTMKEDIANIQQGQKPAGIQVPTRKIEPPSAPTAPVKPGTPPPAPGSQFKVTPPASLGESKKSAPLPRPSKPFSLPSFPKSPEPTMPAPKPTAPPSLVVPPVPPAQQKQQVYIPPADVGGDSGSRNKLFLMIAGLAVVFGFLYWFLILRSPSPDITEQTPTPSPESTPVAKLAEIFTGSSTPVSLDGDDLAQSLNSSLDKMVLEAGKFNKLLLTNTKGEFLSWLNIITPPQQIIDTLGSDLIMLAYGQQEIFDSKGALMNPDITVSSPTTALSGRLAIIAEVKDVSFASQGLSGWESTMPADFQKLFKLEIPKQANAEFLNSTYGGFSVRFRNFIWPDKSIDHGVILSFNGNNYLVITNSRESMFAAIDVLKGIIKQTPTPPPSASPSL